MSCWLNCRFDLRMEVACAAADDEDDAGAVEIPTGFSVAGVTVISTSTSVKDSAVVPCAVALAVSLINCACCCDAEILDCGSGGNDKSAEDEVDVDVVDCSLAMSRLGVVVIILSFVRDDANGTAFEDCTFKGMLCISMFIPIPISLSMSTSTSTSISVGIFVISILILADSF